MAGDGRDARLGRQAHMAEPVRAVEVPHTMLFGGLLGIAQVLDDLERATGRLELDPRQGVAAQAGTAWSFGRGRRTVCAGVSIS